ncbi:DUF1772-domain-containing protein [Eremomyces bilateralis CBS 781.70]|uniref:DUF1772-domain-containing protein n=1 Tax=Eremomyces bilateralis CBS 781.70 TaxID=1392243 RepID=A0A6G1FU58_9PEZI|nr:DUF1772-domain-containing protein [Eremomyces bilateralis CBS 781.70]KAF1809425.1 DUF1772-domain-containing protein [Eremomyces bilateralis CBS 781.70]
MADRVQIEGSLLIKLAQLVGIAGGALVTAISGGASFMLVPALKAGPASVLVRQWRVAYGIGARSAPPISIVTSLAWAYLASKARHHPATPSGPFTFYTLAAVLGPAIVPYTLVVMKSTNGRLSELAAAADKASEKVQEKEATQLIEKWKWLNAVRGVSVFSALMCGAYAIVTWPEIAIWAA